MQRATLPLCLLALLAPAARSQPPLVHEIAPGVFYRDAEPEKRIIANTGWIVFRDFVLVIDANFPWGAQAVLKDLRRTTDKPIRFVFDTHYHADHTYGNSVFVDAGATIVCSEECTADSKERNTRGWAADKGTGEFSLKPFRLEHPQLSFRDTMVIDDGARRVELIRVGPAHTRGDAVAWLPKERILFTGDLVVTRPGNFVGDPSVDPEGWVRALDALSARDARIVVSGHGPQGTAAAIRGNRAYLADIIRQVRAGIARGATADELEKSIDLKSHNPWGQDDARNRTSIRAWYQVLKTR